VGQTKTLDLTAEIGTIYYYAKSSDGSKEWTLPDGHPQASADDISDEHMIIPADISLKGDDGYRWVNFIEFEFDSDPITINFNE
jgi:hypothetical protein